MRERAGQPKGYKAKASDTSFLILQIKSEDYIFVVTNSFTKCMTPLDLQTTENNQEMEFVLLHLIRYRHQLERIVWWWGKSCFLLFAYKLV